jgi:adenine specific DNA methylase Mod
MPTDYILGGESVPDEWKNKLYFGDNLDILREYIADESVDLIYLDPPFNSNATYNVLFAEKTGAKSAAQITAFEDTWHWGSESDYAYMEVVTQGPPKIAKLLSALREFLGNTDIMAYLTMMAQRLVELQRVLKPTGSIYLHCDPTASHYLKMLLDAIFTPINFRNEIVWKRTTAHSSAKKYAPLHDVLLYYSKSSQCIWNEPRTDYEEAYLNSTW